MNVLVTGGSHGIGLAIARKFYTRDNKVFIASRNPDVVKTREGMSEVITVPLEATDWEDIRDKRDWVSSQEIDILINNVGGGGRWGDDGTLMTSEQVWQGVFNKNYEAARLLTLAVLPNMKEKKFGRVVTISSVHGKESGGRPWFNVAKAAEIALMKSLSRDSSLVRCGITFNTVAPGGIFIPDTGWDDILKKEPDKYNSFCDSLPMGRLGTPEEVASVVVFLCSKEAGFVNGACIAVDGGESRSY
jgi:3-oxoacyl-[acyl-carrier protein] reductase